jgi:hypothetical protein
MLKKLLSFIRKLKSAKSINNDAVTKSDNGGYYLKKVSDDLQKNSQSGKYATEIAQFQKQSIDTVLAHLGNTEYSKHRILMKEVNFLVHYTFCVLQDDFYKGNKIFTKGITKIDDYVFSQYRKNPELEHNIKKLTTLAFSNRFDENPRENLLAYFVFIEETGFELIMLLEDFYGMLSNSEKKNRFDLGFKKNFQLTKNYEKKQNGEMGIEGQTQYDTLMTQNLTEMVSPAKAQRRIMEDVLKNEQKGLKK